MSLDQDKIIRIEEEAKKIRTVGDVYEFVERTLAQQSAAATPA